MHLQYTHRKYYILNLMTKSSISFQAGFSLLTQIV